MSELVQNVAAIAVCIAAATFVAWRTWKALRGRSGGCGTGCGSCSSAKTPTAKTLISIDANPEVPRRS